jgi:hypothetical protein
MKLSFGVIALIFLVLLIIMCSSCAGSYVPYHDDKVFTIQYPYDSEAFTAMKSGVDAVVSAVSGEKKESKKEGCTKVEGFGLMPAPYGVDAPIDRFSALKSSKTCTGSPYSTSSGYICMDKEAEKLLSTRGGNISGGDSQIGTA